MTEKHSVVSGCPVCRKQTNHVVRFLEKIEVDSDYDWRTDVYMIVKCLGCDGLSFRLEERHTSEACQAYLPRNGGLLEKQFFDIGRNWP